MISFINFASAQGHVPLCRHEKVRRDLISRYIWIVDTITRYGRLSRKELTDLWRRSPVSDGEELPERTFYHYRRSIEENFHIDIKCDPGGRYYIDQDTDERNKTLSNWLLDSYAVNNAMKETRGTAGRVAVEDVPSAREFLPLLLEAISESRKLCFTYAGFNRSRAETDILFRPYFVKRYKQRWYMIGYKEQASDIRTYALDRVKEMKILTDTFEMPPEVNPSDFFEDLIGITYSKAPARTVKIQTTTTQAKYFRALPFHSSQCEYLHDTYSIFTFRLKLNYELVHELLSYGDSIRVLEPKELKVMVVNELKNTLALYTEKKEDTI